MKRFRWSRRTTLLLSNKKIFRNFSFKNQSQLLTAFDGGILAIYFLLVQRPVASLEKKYQEKLREHFIWKFMRTAKFCSCWSNFSRNISHN